MLVLGSAVTGAHADVEGTHALLWGQTNPQTMVCPRPATRSSLCAPTQVAVDSAGNVWVADFDDNRVLMYPPGSTVATRVIGQYGSFATRACNRRRPAHSAFPNRPSQYTLCGPIGLAVNAVGTLFVSDSRNNRVLVYVHAAQKAAATPADLVLGQSTFTATSPNGTPAGHTGSYACGKPSPASRCTLSGPMGLSLDSAGDLLVPDYLNNRILLWRAATFHAFGSGSCSHACYIPASQVWGQYGSFHTATPNNPARPPDASPRCTAIVPESAPANACTLDGPWSALADSAGNLIVTDTDNNRLLEYAGALANDRQDATAIFGQSSYTTNRPNGGSLGASSLWHPISVTLAGGGTLWIADHYNDRLLGLTRTQDGLADAASAVVGQQGSFTSTACSLGYGGLCGPIGLAFERNGDMLVADSLHNRVIERLGTQQNG